MSSGKGDYCTSRRLLLLLQIDLTVAGTCLNSECGRFERLGQLFFFNFVFCGVWSVLYCIAPKYTLVCGYCKCLICKIFLLFYSNLVSEYRSHLRFCRSFGSRMVDSGDLASARWMVRTLESDLPTSLPYECHLCSSKWLHYYYVIFQLTKL